RFMSVTGFRDDNHVRFAFEDGGDPFAQHRVVIHCENPNGIVGVHSSSLIDARRPAEPGTLRFGAKGLMGCCHPDNQFNFSHISGTAAYLRLRANHARPLPHSLQGPVVRVAPSSRVLESMTRPSSRPRKRNRRRSYVISTSTSRHSERVRALTLDTQARWLSELEPACPPKEL